MPAPAAWEVEMRGQLLDQLNPNQLLLLSGWSFLHNCVVDNKAFGARCWAQHTRFLLPGRSLYSSVHFAFHFFFLLVLCVPRGLSISPFLSKRWASPGPAGRKSCYIWFQVSPYSKPHTSLWRLRTSMIHCQGAKHLLIGASLAELISVEGWLLLPLPLPLSCFLVLQGWFHLRSSCVYFSLIILNFLKGDTLYHGISS